MSQKLDKDKVIAFLEEKGKDAAYEEVLAVHNRNYDDAMKYDLKQKIFNDLIEEIKNGNIDKGTEN